jgi:hypothetical protein
VPAETLALTLCAGLYVIAHMAGAQKLAKAAKLYTSAVPAALLVDGKWICLGMHARRR